MNLLHISVNKILAVVKQARLFFSVMGLLAIVSGFILTKNYNLVQLFWASISYIFGAIFSSSVNNTYDVSFDSVSNTMSSQNPIVTRELTFKEAQIMNYITPLLAISTSIFVGPYWTLFILIGIGLEILYDVKPFRLKDRPLGFLIVPFWEAFPFLFIYINTTSSIAFPSSVFLIFIFLYVNLITLVRYVPDFEKDRQMNVQNFTAIYSVEATRILELIISIILPIIFSLAIILNCLSVFGLPILMLTTGLRLSVLMKPNNVLKNPQVWKRFAQAIIINNSALVIGIAGKF